MICRTMGDAGSPAAAAAAATAAALAGCARGVTADDEVAVDERLLREGWPAPSDSFAKSQVADGRGVIVAAGAADKGF